MERSHSEELVKQSADRIADVILRSTHYEMLHNDRDALLQHHPGARQRAGHPAHPHLQQGRPHHAFHRRREVGTVVDKSAEACYGCHAQSAPLAKLNRTDRARIFTDKQGQQRAGGDPAHRQCAGLLQRRLPRPSGRPAGARRDRRQSLAGHGGRADGAAPGDPGAGSWSAAIVFGCGAAVAFIWVVVYRPVKELIDGTHRVADGDLDYRLPVRSDDELGDLAALLQQDDRRSGRRAGARSRSRCGARRPSWSGSTRRCSARRRWPPSASWPPPWRTRSTIRCSAS